jgi:hypothetical protein
MRLFLIALMPLLASLDAQDAEVQKRFTGTWEAKLKDKVICSITLRAGEPISGEMDFCSIHVDANGELEEPESIQQSGNPSRLLNAKLQGDTLTFGLKDDDDVVKMEMKLVAEGRAEVKILDPAVSIKPIPFGRK